MKDKYEFINYNKNQILEKSASKKPIAFIKKAFLFLLLFVLTSLIVQITRGTFNHNLESFFKLILFVTVFSFFMGILNFLVHKIRKKDNQKLHIKNYYPIPEFIKIGFKYKNNYLIGKIKGYDIIVSNLSYKGANNCIYIIILFDPKINEDYSLLKWQNAINNKYNYWKYGRLVTVWPLESDIPKFNTIKKKLMKNLNLISNKNLRKIDVEKWLSIMDLNEACFEDAFL